MYFLEGIDEKPRNRIPLSNAVIEGIFFRDDLYVITIRCSREHSSFYTLGHHDEREIKDWFEQLKRAIELADTQEAGRKHTRNTSNAGLFPIKPTDSMVNEELAVPISASLKHAYDETMRLAGKGLGSEWRSVKLKNCAIVRELIADPELVQFSMTLRNTPIAMVYETLLVRGM